MALTLRANDSSFASSASPTITIPASTEGGDAMYIVTAGGWNPSATPPAGWTLVSVQTGIYWNWAIYSKVASGSPGSVSPEAGTVVTMTYTGGVFDVQSAIYVVAGCNVTPVISSISSNACTAGTINLTAASNDLLLYYGSARPNTSVTVTLSRGTTDITRSSDTNSGSVIGHESPSAGAISQIFTPSTAGSGSTGRLYVVLQLNEIFEDNFADAGSLTTPFAISGKDTTAWGIEASEPGGMSHTGWATFTPSQTSVYNLSTVGSDFDTILAVYTGTALDNLVLVDSDDDSGGSGTSLLNVILTSGTTYRVQVGAQAAGSGGVLSFSITQLASARMASDYIEVASANDASSRTALVYTEAAIAADPSLTERRVAAVYTEVTGTNMTTIERQVATVYFEVLTPSEPQYMGWGVQK